MNPVSFKQMVQTSVPQVTGQSGKDAFKLFLTSNEGNQTHTVKMLANTPLAGSVMLGISGFFTLDAASVAGTAASEKIKYVVIVDLSLHVKKFWMAAETIIRKANSRSEAVDLLVTNIIDNCAEYWPIPHCTCCPIPIKRAAACVDQLSKMVNGFDDTSWLASDKRFNRIREIFVSNRFAFVQGDLSDERITSGITDVLESQNLKFHAVYISNVREYCENSRYTTSNSDRIPELRRSLSKFKNVSTNLTVIIDTEPRVGGMELQSPGLIQRTFTHFVSEDIVNTIPYSPPSPATFEKFREEVKKSFPSGMPADPKLQKLWALVVIYNMVKFKIVNT